MAGHQPAHLSRRGRLLMLLVLAAVSIAVALRSGSVPLAWGDLWLTLRGAGSALQHSVIMDLRLPRALSAFATGGMLALSGALLQVLLRNPLADPYVLGVSGGASAGALAALLLGTGGLMLTAAAFVGALISILMVFALAHGRGHWGPARLLLTGVVIASGWGAVISLLLSLSPDTHLRGMLFWLMGDLSNAAFPYAALVILAGALLLCMPWARTLNVLSHGELRAAALGVPVARARISLYLAASLLTAAAVTTAGNIGFVGLIVPHIVRLAIGADHRVLLPASALLGGSLLVIADTLARSALAPQQLPVGVVTALLGVPVFLVLLQRSAR
jgi:iron complex transport system permease protein